MKYLGILVRYNLTKYVQDLYENPITPYRFHLYYTVPYTILSFPDYYHRFLLSLPASTFDFVSFLLIIAMIILKLDHISP